jgi:hypothetical protein
VFSNLIHRASGVADIIIFCSSAPEPDARRERSLSADSSAISDQLNSVAADEETESTDESFTKPSGLEEVSLVAEDDQLTTDDDDMTIATPGARLLTYNEAAPEVTTFAYRTSSVAPMEPANNPPGLTLVRGRAFHTSMMRQTWGLCH